jgi:hypothetical protein
MMNFWLGFVTGIFLGSFLAAGVLLFFKGAHANDFEEGQ